MHAVIGPTLTYLGRLIKRMDRGHFPVDNPFRRTVQEAYDKIHGPCVRLHYVNCPSGACGPFDEPDSAIQWRPVHESTRGGWLALFEQAQKLADAERKLPEGMPAD